MPPSLKRTLYTGTFISTPTPSSLRILENHAVAVDEDGIIRHVGALEAGDGRAWVERNWGGEGEWVRGEGWWFPGFVGEWVFVLFF